MKEYIEGDCPKCGLPLEVIELENGIVKGNKQYRCICGYKYIYRTEECKKAYENDTSLPSNVKRIEIHYNENNQ